MRNYDYDYQIDKNPMLVPDAGVEISFSDLDGEDSGRDEAGFMHRTVLRERVRTWSFSYAVLTAEEYRYLDALFRGKPTFTFAFRGLDGHPTECQAYCSKGSITLYNQRTGLYKNMKFNIIEC